MSGTEAAERPLRRDVVVQPTTEHSLVFLPPCLEQCCVPEFALVAHPLVVQVPNVPCLLQRPHAIGCKSVPVEYVFDFALVLTLTAVL